MLKWVSTLLSILLIFFSATLYAKTYGERICNQDERFYCYKVKKGDSWQKLFKDPEREDFEMRLNRMNTRLRTGMTIAIPKDETLDVMEIAPFDKQIDPPGERMIIVSLSDLAWGAYDEQGSLVSWGPVSGGKQYCPDVGRRCTTTTGTFSIYRKGSGDCVSTKFPVDRGGAPMPYCMFFNGGFALHGSYEVPGYNASHGCVRLFVNDAKWLNQDFVDEGVPVIVKSN